MIRAERNPSDNPENPDHSGTLMIRCPFNSRQKEAVMIDGFNEWIYLPFYGRFWEIYDTNSIHRECFLFQGIHFKAYDPEDVPGGVVVQAVGVLHKKISYSRHRYLIKALRKLLRNMIIATKVKQEPVKIQQKQIVIRRKPKEQ